MKRKIPPWVIIVAFAAATGGAIGGFAYLRRPDRPSYCITKLAGRSLAVVERAEDRCTTRVPELTIVRRRGDFLTRLRALETETRLPSEAIAADPPVQAAMLETTVQATRATRIGILARRDDVIELHFDPAVFSKDQALAAMRELVRR